MEYVIVLAGHFRDIDFTVICSSFTRHSSSGWGINAAISHDTAYSYSSKTLYKPLEIAAFSRKGNLILAVDIHLSSKLGVELQLNRLTFVSLLGMVFLR